MHSQNIYFSNFNYFIAATVNLIDAEIKITLHNQRNQVNLLFS